MGRFRRRLWHWTTGRAGEGPFRRRVGHRVTETDHTADEGIDRDEERERAQVR
jgi:hypothetical protein